MKWPWWLKLLVTLIALGVVLGAIVGLKVVQIGSLIGFATEAEEMGMPPVPVATTTAKHDSWEDVENFTGSMKAAQGGMLTAEVGGIITEVNVENGAEVKKGDILFRSDASQEQADLAAARAGLRLAKINLDRSEGLMKKRIIAQSEYDTVRAEYDQAAARVQELQARIAKKVVRAPFDGRAGIRMANIGETIREGDELIPVHASDPIFIDFAVPQTKLHKLELGQPVRVKTDGLELPIEGKITAINPVFESETRTALVQGTLRNQDGKLRAGQFGEVEVVRPQRIEVLSIPLSAVVAAAYGQSVFIIEGEGDNLTVRQQFVRLGERRGDFISVLKGLKEGDRVVSAGAFKLQNGARVIVNDEMQPVPQLEPSPDNS